MLSTLRPGRYLLTHAPGSSRVCIFAALPDDLDTEEVPPLAGSLVIRSCLVPKEELA